MRKSISFLFIVLSVLLLLTGCTSSKSFSYNVETGDKIKVELDTSNKYDLSSDVPFTVPNSSDMSDSSNMYSFTVSKDGTTQTKGMFLTSDGYNSYVDTINSTTETTVIDKGSKNGVTYVFYSVNNSEFNYVLKVDNSNSGVLLHNTVSKESAEECFNRLTFSKE